MRVCLLSLLFLLTLARCKSTGSNHPVSAPSAGVEANDVTRRIEEEAFVPVGGIEQWITIQGENRDNPVVLFLHGGPGNTLTPFADAIYGGWAGDFTLVQWDQRGAGKTFGRNPPPGSGRVPICSTRMWASVRS